MRKIDCIAIRITGNTNFKTKLNIFVSQFDRENRAESQNYENSPALKRCLSSLDAVPTLSYAVDSR